MSGYAGVLSRPRTRTRTRTRRRRPPTSRIVLALALFGALISQTAWWALDAVRHPYLLALAPLYVMMVAQVRRHLRLARYAERHGRPLSVGASEWLLAGLLWALQVLLWTTLA